MRIFTFALLLAAMTAPLSAQDNPHATHGTHGDHGTMSGPTKGGMPAEPGQSAFAAIQEIVALLEGDPATDWSKVDVEALRQHLIDMNNVTLAATVASEPMAGGIRYQISGQGAVVQSIQRMVVAPARMMDGANGIAMKQPGRRGPVGDSCARAPAETPCPRLHRPDDLRHAPSVPPLDDRHWRRSASLTGLASFSRAFAQVLRQ